MGFSGLRGVWDEGKALNFTAPSILSHEFPHGFTSRHTRASQLTPVGMLPPTAEKKLQCWIRSRHVICSGNFFVFETVDYSALERFTDCIKTLGGTIVSVDSVGKIWMGNHRQIVLYRARASLHTPHHNLKQYWIKYGSFRTRFEQQI